jgi:hypothetical protein
VEVDREYMAATNISAGSYTGYYFHNLHFVMYARSMQGHRAETLQAADAIASAAGPMAQAMPEMVDSFLSQAIFARVRTLAWNDVLKMARPDDKLPLTSAMWHYGRSLTLLANKDRAGEVAERAAFEQSAAKIPADASWGNNKAGEVMNLAREVVAARFGEDAIAHWRRAVEIQDSLVYDEPPAWYYPVRESLGAELVRAGQPAEGEVVLREGLRRSPRNGYMLFGLMESLKAQGKDISEVKREFDAVWAKSDVQLSLGVL